jgi:hypothetical protein
MPEKFASVLVTRVYLADHWWMYRKPHFHPPRPTLKTLHISENIEHLD